ncbi:phosphoglycerate kinase [Candidatus Pelagibacter sp.]|nr:phosphoglycerate kinase [Candidatus Pelagibacter sp.]
MNNIKDYENLNQKKVLLRLDLNVPLKNGVITDQTRIDKILPIVKFLLNRNSQIIIISHVGRPKGKIHKDLSLKPICENLEKKINKRIKIINDDIFKLKKEDLLKDPNDQIVFLENIRFYKEEEENNFSFAKHLAGLADLFVNDAFSCSHRAHASVCKITEFLPSFAGLQLETEINALKKVTTEIKKPITCIIGGSKISTKIGIIKNLITKFDNIIIVGGMANNILSHKGIQIGKSIKEENCETIIKEIFETSKNHSCTITYPEDVLVGKNVNDTSEVKELNSIKHDDLILDIGPKTINKIKNFIETSETVLWNGPAGYFENPNFANGSYEIAKAIIKKNKNKSIYSVAGGGDTIALINQINAIGDFNFVSTAGGAFLEYLEGKELPGIKALK